MKSLAPRVQRWLASFEARPDYWVIGAMMLRMGSLPTFRETEAHEALSRLLRFAQFANDNWRELTA